MKDTFWRKVSRMFHRRESTMESVNLDPFVVKKISLLGQSLRLMTHRQDRVLSAMIRGEKPLCRHYQAELMWLKEQVQPGDLVLDAGANIGSVSIVLGLAEPKALICAFEPDPINFALLQTNLVLNGCQNICAFNFALGSEQGLVRFFRSPDNFGDHRSSPPKGIDLRESEFVQHLTPISKIKASSFLQRCFEQQMLDLVKIDTQGADFEILGDILPLLKRGSKVAIEFSPYHLDANGTSYEQIIKLLSEFRSILKISPDPDFYYELEQTDSEALLEFFDEQRERYRTYLDLVLVK